MERVAERARRRVRPESDARVSRTRRETVAPRPPRGTDRVPTRVAPPIGDRFAPAAVSDGGFLRRLVEILRRVWAAISLFLGLGGERGGGAEGTPVNTQEAAWAAATRGVEASRARGGGRGGGEVVGGTGGGSGGGAGASAKTRRGPARKHPHARIVATTTTTTDGTDSITETPPCGAVAAVTTATTEGVAARWMSFSEWCSARPRISQKEITVSRSSSASRSRRSARVVRLAFTPRCP